MPKSVRRGPNVQARDLAVDLHQALDLTRGQTTVPAVELLIHCLKCRAKNYLLK